MSLQLRTGGPKLDGMSDLPSSFRAVIELWPSREAMAADIGARSSAVSKWWQRDGIPAEWWATVLSTDKAREKDITAEVLTGLAARETVDART